MRKTKDQRFKFNIKNNKGITLISLVPGIEDILKERLNMFMKNKQIL